MVTFHDLTDSEVKINPAMVQSVSSFQWYDHDLELPDEFYHINSGGLKEINPFKREEADALRTFPRTIITTSLATFIVKESLDDVEKALG